MFLALHILIQLALIVRVLLRPHREPASRSAWVVVIIALPVLGILAYLLFGEVNIGRRRVQRMREVLAQMPEGTKAGGAYGSHARADIPQAYAHLFRVGHSISGFEPIGGNQARLLPDSDATVDAATVRRRRSWRARIHPSAWLFPVPVRVRSLCLSH